MKFDLVIKNGRIIGKATYKELRNNLEGIEMVNLTFIYEDFIRRVK